MPHANLESLDPDLAAKVSRVLARLSAAGFSPGIASGWRTPAEQKALLDKGYSRVSFSFHNAVDAAGKPAALACDIIDRTLGWGFTDRHVSFVRALGQAAKAEGLYWGGDWKRSNPSWAKFDIGWDPHHVQLYDNNALGQVRAQTQAVWDALKTGNVAMVPWVAAKGYAKVLEALPWWYWVGIGTLGVLILGGLVISSRRRRRLSS